MKRQLRLEALESRECPANGSSLVTIGSGTGYTLQINTYGRIAAMEVSPSEFATWSTGSQSTTEVRALSQRIYQHLPDVFDFVMVVNNQSTSPSGSQYSGINYGVRNTTSGIGVSQYNNTAAYGSAGELESFIHLITRSMVAGGPSLHEIMHRWGNFLPQVNGGVSGHWGFSGVGGQLGGWQPGTLVSLGGGQYDANGPSGGTSFGTVANGGNGIPYSELELYLMGLIDQSAVTSPIQVATNPAWVNQSQGVFSASAIQNVTMADIVAANGVRSPGPATSQKNFRVLTVVLTPSAMTQAQIDEMDTAVEFFGLAGSNGTSLYNFWEATGGRATLTMDGLNAFIPGSGVASTITVQSGNNQTTTVNTAFSNSLVVTVRDALGSPLPGQTVTFAGPGSGAGVTFPSGTTAVTNASGQATIAVSANTVAGSYTVTASVAGVATPANFSLTNTPGAPSSLTIVSGSGQTTTVTAAFANPLVARVADSFGNPVSGITVTFTRPTSGASVNFTTSSTPTTNASGQASVSISANGTAGSYSVSASATGIAGTISFALTNIITPLSITPSVLANGTGNTFYTQTLSASGTPGPFTFSVTAGSLPPGLTLSSGGVLSGTPTATGTSNFTVGVTSTTGVGSQVYALTVNPAPLTLTPTSLVTATAAATYSQTLTASGTPGPFTYAITTGSLPPGLTLSSDGVLSGTPTATGTSNFTVGVTSATGAGSRSYSLTVNPALLTVNPTLIPDATINTAYSETLTASGTPGPFTFGITSGALPQGLTLTSAGVLSGTPTATGTSIFTVQASSALGFGSRMYTMTVNPPGTINLTPASLTAATINVAYTQTITASGTPGPFTFNVSEGTLPNGLTLSSTGVLSGTPTDAGTTNFTIEVTSPTGTGSREYSLTVNPPGVLTLTPDTLPDGTTGTNYSQAITASGTPGPFTFSLAMGSLPSGLTLSSTGMLSGTPTTAGTSTFTIAVTSATGSGSRQYTLTVAAPPPATSGDNLTVSGYGGAVSLLTPNSAGQYANSGVTFFPFNGYTGAVRTAHGDVNGDGIDDIIFVTGPGTPIRVTIYSGENGFPLLFPAFDPFGGDFQGGGFLTAADIDGDGFAEFAVTPDQGGGPRVTIFSIVGGDALAVRANFFGIDDPNFRGGCRAALGDVNNDGTPDLAVAAGFLGGPRVAIFNGTTILSTNPTRMINDFFAFPGDDAVRLRNGAFVTLGDINGDGYADAIFGGGPGGAPRVFMLSGEFLAAGNVSAAYAAPLANFFVAGNSTDRGGVRPTVKNADGDTKADLVVGSGEEAPARARIYLGKDFTTTGEPSIVQEVDAFGGVILPGGIYVG